MIPCPSCGTQNRRGSKYCYNCGQRLDLVFDAACPACDRLNPTGSAFCAFCGARIPPPSEAESAAAEQPEQIPAAPPESAPKGAQLAGMPRRELPPWLYEPTPEQPEVLAPAPGISPLPSEVPAPEEESKYLRDIGGALPKAHVWLPSVQERAVAQPGANQTPQMKPDQRAGCLTLGVAAGLGAIGIALLLAV